MCPQRQGISQSSFNLTVKFSLVEVEWFRKISTNSFILLIIAVSCQLVLRCVAEQRTAPLPHTIFRLGLLSHYFPLCMWTLYPENLTEFAVWNILVIHPILANSLIPFWQHTHAQNSWNILWDFQCSSSHSKLEKSFCAVPTYVRALSNSGNYTN